jgi:hypothetical protein
VRHESSVQQVSITPHTVLSLLVGGAASFGRAVCRVVSRPPLLQRRWQADVSLMTSVCSSRGEM